MRGRSYYLGYKAGSGEVTVDRVRPDGSGVDTLHADTWRSGWSTWVPFTLPGETDPHFLGYRSTPFSGEADVERGYRNDGIDLQSNA